MQFDMEFHSDTRNIYTDIEFSYCFALIPQVPVHNYIKSLIKSGIVVFT